MFPSPQLICGKYTAHSNEKTKQNTVLRCVCHCHYMMLAVDRNKSDTLGEQVFSEKDQIVMQCKPCLADLQEHSAKSSAAVSRKDSQVWSRPARGEAQPFPGGTNRPTVRTDAGVVQTQHAVQHSRIE